MAIDYKLLVRRNCISIIEEHIKTRLAQTGCVLRAGSPAGQAKFVVSRWSDVSTHVFMILADSGDWKSHAGLATELGAPVKASENFWRKTLCKLAVPARLADGSEPLKLRLFRRGHERFFSDRGIKLQLNTEMLAFTLARHATESTIGTTVAFRQNYEGAAAAQEADVSKPLEERVEARERMNQEMTPPAAAERQAGLFDARAAE